MSDGRTTVVMTVATSCPRTLVFVVESNGEDCYRGSNFDNHYRDQLIRGAALLARGLAFGSFEVHVDGSKIISAPVSVIQGVEER